MQSRRNPLPPRTRHGPGWPITAGVFLAFVTVAAIAVALINPFSGSGSEDVNRYKEAIIGSPARVSPLYAHMNDADRDLTRLIFSGLTRLSHDGEVLPDLAESWEITPDNRTYTFHLRQNVFWHTGATFTADDVIFTLDLLTNPETQADPEQAALWDQVDCFAVNQFTVRCTLPEPFAPFLAYATTGIVPQHVLGDKPPAELMDDPFNRSPIGTGPFRVMQLDQSHAVLRAYQRYHLDAPQIGEIELRFYPDSSSAAGDLVRRQVDGLMVDLTVNPADYEALASVGGVRAHSANRSAYTVLYLNNNEPPLNEKAVREAIAHTVDTDAIIGGILGGRAVRADSAIVPGTWAFDPDVQGHSHDLRLAREILDDAGWELPEDGDVRRKGTTNLSITILTDQDTLRGAVAEEIASQLAEVGIDASVRQETSTALVRNFLLPREYQAAIFAWDTAPDPDPYPAWHSSQASGNGRNLAAYISERADTLMEDARRTTNVDVRQRLYHRFQRVFREDVPSVLLYYPVFTYFVTDEVKNIQVGTLFTTASRFVNVHEWQLEKRADIRTE
jgi:peptide/nickel transport system substrate-binding protein